METTYKFVDNTQELISSVIEFYDTPKFWRAAVGRNPHYFVCIENEGHYLFGLSKFYAFKNISVQDYLTEYRKKIGGGTTQQHIATITNQSWIKRANISDELRNSFDEWILGFFPNYNLKNASLILLKTQDEEIKKEKKTFRKKTISPDELIKQLQHQKNIGDIGEEIALTFEQNRLTENGILNAIDYVDHVSKRDIAAGYDIYSITNKEERFIEVKSSTSDTHEFFISEGELNILEAFEDKAYIYFVRITNLNKKQGHVYAVLKNPVKQLKEIGNLKPILYKASLENKITADKSIAASGA